MMASTKFIHARPRSTARGVRVGIARPWAFLCILHSAFIILHSAASAAPTQDEVFRSIQDNLGEPADPTKLIAVLLGFVALIIMVVIFNKARQRDAVSKPLNHSGRLVKELQKEVNLKPAELRQLKALAEGQPVDNPLTLLLCPSLLVKAAKETPEKFDRKIVGAMIKRIGN